MFYSQMTLAKVIGAVMILRGGAELLHNAKIQQLKTGSQISEGDQIETKASTYVKVVMKDRNVLVITENTKLAINEYKTTKDSKKVQMEIAFGSARHFLEQKYKNKDEKYEVRTATTVAGVRGTDFLTEYNVETGDSVLCALEGKVSLDILKNGKAEQKPVIVDAGHFVRFKKSDLIPQVIETNKAWLDKALLKHSLE